jgi:hypothetical protein
VHAELMQEGVMTALRSRRQETGSVLVVSLVTGVFVAGITYALVLVSQGEISGAGSASRQTKALLAAEAGIGESFDRLNRGDNPSIDRSDDAHLAYRVTATNLGTSAAGNRVYRLASTAAFSGEERAVEVVVENQSRRLRSRGAITANGPVALSGSVVVDGRDYDANGFGVVGPGVYGVVSSQDVTMGGSSSMGGMGTAPTRTPPASIYDQDLKYGDGIDNDGDGRVDEEAFDGIDNDGDGRVDEDLAPFPTSPDSIFGLPDGTLNQYAQNQGTYFTSFGALSSYMARHDNEIPGGKVIVIDIPSTPESGPVWNPADFGSEMNEDPSIIIFHSANNNAVAKDMHGRLKGLLVTDYVDHVNGTAEILGGVITLGTSQVGNVFGNGNAQVLYSSAVLGTLPGVPFYVQRAWREVTASR